MHRCTIGLVIVAYLLTGVLGCAVPQKINFVTRNSDGRITTVDENPQCEDGVLSSGKKVMICYNNQSASQTLMPTKPQVIILIGMTLFKGTRPTIIDINNGFMKCEDEWVPCLADPKTGETVFCELDSLCPEL